MERFGRMSCSGSIRIVSFFFNTYGYCRLTSPDRPNPPPLHAISPDPELESTNAHEYTPPSRLKNPQISEIVEPGSSEENPAASDEKKSSYAPCASSPLSDPPSPVPETVVGPKKDRKGKKKVPKKADISRTKVGITAESRKRSRSISDDDIDDIVIVRHMIDLSGDLEDVCPYSVGEFIISSCV